METAHKNAACLDLHEKRPLFMSDFRRNRRSRSFTMTGSMAKAQT
jgi:hypothetical protein